MRWLTHLRLPLAAIVAIAFSGCSTTLNWADALPKIPPPSFGWLFGKSNKPGPLPALPSLA